MGLQATKQWLATSQLNERKAALVRAWIADQEAALSDAEREIDRTLKREANDIARKALNRATWSTVIAGLALAVAGLALVLEAVS